MPESQVIFNFRSALGASRVSRAAWRELKGEHTRGSVRVPHISHYFLHDADRNGRYSVVPWNALLPLMIISVTLPLICGNTVVARPSDICPHTFLVADALHDVGKQTRPRLVTKLILILG